MFPTAARRHLARLLALALLAAGCERRAAREPAPAAPPDTSAARADTAVTPAHPPAPLAWSRVAVQSPRRLASIVDSLGAGRWFYTLKLNRVDLAHVRDRDSLVLPSRWDDTLALAPFPRAIEALRDTAKFALVSIRVQAFACYDSGRLVRWGPVSTGREDKPTPVGLYHTNWKDKDRVSTVDEAWLLHWYVNLQNFQGVSFHQYELPGRPASHSCVRLLEEDAMWVYAWSEQWRLGPDRKTILREGTPVVVWGEWAWGQRPPWKRLPENPGACALAAGEIAEALGVLGQRVKPDFSTIVETPADSARHNAAPPDTSRRPAPADSAATR